MRLFPASRPAILLVALLPVLAACRTAEPVVVPAQAVIPAELAGHLSGLSGESRAEALPPSMENLNASLWSATAVEYRALAEQAYALARVRLDQALADTSWTAALEQGPAFGSLPPAVVLDVDETVLDNTVYQLRLIDRGETYAGDSWASWVEEAAATPVPGALEFTRHAASRGVRVIYLTNRDAEGEAATRRNLDRLGFPLTDDPDDVITQGERPEWSASDKAPRRAHVAGLHRIILLIGDNFGDFLSDHRARLQEREQLFAAHDSYWGNRWIVLPNAMYGSWEAATFDHAFSLPFDQRIRQKLDLVRRLVRE